MGIPGIVDLGGKSADEIEKQASALEPGWFKAMVQDVYEQDGTLFLDFKLGDGRSVLERLWDPNRSDTDQKRQKSQQRRDLFAIRLGLVPRDARGTAFEFDWLNAIGRECVVEMDYSKPREEGGAKYVNLTYSGIYEPNDPRVPEVIRKGAVWAPLKSAAGIAKESKGYKTSAVSSPPAAAASKAAQLNLDDL